MDLMANNVADGPGKFKSLDNTHRHMGITWAVLGQDLDSMILPTPGML